tara:strand:- start:72 stop:875 length:804 start_codon:yes stop_codon:yes gene_type:complete
MIKFISIVIISVLIQGCGMLAHGNSDKIIEIQGQKFIAVTTNDGEYKLKPYIEPEQINVIEELHEDELLAVRSTEFIQYPEWQKTVTEESKIVQTCDNPLGCPMTIEGDCPDCYKEFVSEKTTIETFKECKTWKMFGQNKICMEEKTENDLSFEEFSKNIDQKKINVIQEKLELSNLPSYFNEGLMKKITEKNYGTPLWICYKTLFMCQYETPIQKRQLFEAYTKAEFCDSHYRYNDGSDEFYSENGHQIAINWHDPINTCPSNIIE